MEPKRCPWAKTELEIRYHDEEWGRPLHDDNALFEMLILEGKQAGLRWLTILQKREDMREVFDGFDAEKIAQYNSEKIAELLTDARIIRNRAKVRALVNNAQQFLRIQKEYGSFDRYIWRFVQGQPIINIWDDPEQVPATDMYSDRMAKTLKQEGFQFVGSTTCYAFMQAVGMVNDHMTWCSRYMP